MAVFSFWGWYQLPGNCYGTVARKGRFSGVLRIRNIPVTFHGRWLWGHVRPCVDRAIVNMMESHEELPPTCRNRVLVNAGGNQSGTIGAPGSALWNLRVLIAVCTPPRPLNMSGCVPRCPWSRPPLPVFCNWMTRAGIGWFILKTQLSITNCLNSCQFYEMYSFFGHDCGACHHNISCKSFLLNRLIN